MHSTVSWILIVVASAAIAPKAAEAQSPASSLRAACPLDEELLGSGGGATETLLGVLLVAALVRSEHAVGATASDVADPVCRPWSW
eukprot:SAG31_NODE_5908_length_2262_cov_5.163662_1_plen_86_part_00